MTRYADPRRCPDCRAGITPGTPGCPSCGLTLRGDTAQRLFATLSAADDLLATLRAASPAALAPAAATSRARTPGLEPDRGGDVVTGAPGRPAGPETPRRRGLSQASVPVILLTLGAVCLLAAALVFLAITWVALGVGGRTAVLVAATVAVTALSAWAARRGLRGAAEALAAVGFGLLALDLVGADNAGWLGDLTVPGLLVVLGVALAGTGLTSALAVRRTAAPTLMTAEVAVGIGGLLLVLGIGAGETLPDAPALVLSTLLVAGLAVLCHRLHLGAAATGAGLATGLSWLVLAAHGLDRVDLEQASWRGLWLGGDVWPLLAAAVLVAVPAAVRSLPRAARVGAATVAHLLAVTAAFAPTLRLDPTPLLLVGITVLAVAAVTALALPPAWRLVGALTQILVAVAVLVAVTVMTGEAVGRVTGAADPVWGGGAGARLGPAPSAETLPQGWLLPMAVAALVATVVVLVTAGAGLTRRTSVTAPHGTQVTDRAPGSSRVQAWVSAADPIEAGSRLGAAIGALAVAAAIALYPAPLGLLAGILLLAAAALTAWSLTDDTRQNRRVGAGSAGVGAAEGVVGVAAVAALGAAAVSASLSSEVLTALVATGLVLLGVAVQLRSRSTVVAAVGGAAAGFALAADAWSWGAVLDAAPVHAAAIGLLVLGAAVLAAPYAPRGWSACDDPATAGAGLELAAIAGTAALAAAGVVAAAAPQVWLAVYLTLAGAVVTTLGLLRSREAAGWAGAALLAAASWVRLHDLGVNAPEAYTVPSALVLLVVGLRTLHRDPSASTLRAIGPGLSLALVPSLLQTLVEPTGPRPLLLGLVCLLLVVAGARSGWSGPLVIGAAVGAVLVLRVCAPFVEDALPRWVTIGLAGVLLVTLGVTWERRVQQARAVVGQVRALR